MFQIVNDKIDNIYLYPIPGLSISISYNVTRIRALWIRFVRGSMGGFPRGDGMLSEWAFDPPRKRCCGCLELINGFFQGLGYR